MSFKYKKQGGRVFLMSHNGMWFDESLIEVFYPGVTEFQLLK